MISALVFESNKVILNVITRDMYVKEIYKYTFYILQINEILIYSSRYILNQFLVKKNYKFCEILQRRGQPDR